MWRHFRFLVRWITHHQLLGLTAGLLLVIIGFEGVAGLGLPALFWCREIPGLLFIGFAVAAFFALCSLVGFLLDHRELKYPAQPAALRHYFLETIWFPSVIVAVRGLWRNIVSDSRCGSEWAMLVGYAIGLAIVYYGARRLTHVANPLAGRPWFLKLVNWMASRNNPNAPPNLWLHAYAFLVAVILGAIYIAFNVALMFRDPWLNAGVAITTLLALIVLTYGALRFFAPHALPLIVLAAVIWVSVVNQVPRKHQYDELTDVATVDLATPRKQARLISDEAALNAWRDHLASACKKTRPKLIVVMTSGGGVRASVWTAAVLRELDANVDRCGYLQHVRVIGGASGGMVGAGYWITQRVFQDKNQRSAKQVSDETSDDLRGVTADALDHVARYLVLRDVPALFLPLRIPDRGFALEKAWMNNAPMMGHSFQELRPHELAGTTPSLIYAPASLDDGRRVLVSNLNLDYMTRHAIDGHEATRSAFQFFDVFKDHKLTVATAAHMSASFPYVSSAAELPTKQLRRLGDAGYFDNYGGFVISSWLAANRKWLVDNTSGVLIVQVRDSPVGGDNRDIASVPRKKNGKPKYPYLARAFSELAAPLQGVASTRTKAMHFRTDFELAAVAPLFGDRFVETVEIELPAGVAPLSWNLTKKAANDIIKHAPQEVTAKMKTIEEWWKVDRVGC
jgi:Patatin-like phospholipase